MTEQEWLACNDPQKLLDFLRDIISDRKLRLFALACCRRVWYLFTEFYSPGTRETRITLLTRSST